MAEDNTMEWSKKIYNYGYLLSDDDKVTSADIGVEWSDWVCRDVRSGIKLYVHPLAAYFMHKCSARTHVLVGHAFNPFDMEKDETNILNELERRYNDDNLFYDYVNQLTGVFFYAVIDDKSVSAICDCAGMMGTNYGIINGRVYFSSHSQLIADICGLHDSDYAAGMKEYKLFKLFGWFLPGDETPYEQIHRIIPNTRVALGDGISVERFYPREKYAVSDDYEHSVHAAGKILSDTMKLIAQKWEKPAISLTGGVDSQTTLACANGIQNKFKYYSYISLEREATDAFAAKRICEGLGLEHTIYYIDTDRKAYPDFETADGLIERHYGYLGKGNENDVCKRISLSEQADFDIEVKSWVSEIARASRYKHYLKDKFPDKVSPRQLTTMYKVFLWNRKQAVQKDKLFEKYLSNTRLYEALENTGYPWTEFFVWEIVFGGWGGLALTVEHKLSNDITVPFNNRALLDIMLRTPLEKRKTDALHKDIIKTMDERLFNLGIHVVNGNETHKRAVCERIYYEINTHLPW